MIHILELSKAKYKNLKKFIHEHLGEKIFPGYDAIFSEKQKCYPCNLTIDETSMKSNVLDVVNHTLKRSFAKFTKVTNATQVDKHSEYRFTLNTVFYITR